MDKQFHEIFERLQNLAKETQNLTESIINQEEYVPEPVDKPQQPVPAYIPTPKTYGPKPLTIEEYKARQKPRIQIAPPVIKKKKGRGGKLVKIHKEKKELRRLIQISTGEQKYKFYLQLKDLTQQQAQRKNNKCGGDALERN